MSESVSIYKLGMTGRAYDMPGTCRAYTYRHQPDNVAAGRLGDACWSAYKAGGGDSIDFGLGLLKQLEANGFGVYELGEAKAPEVLQDAVPEETPHIIVFDDADRPNEMFSGAGARPAALRRWQQISVSWNAHLYVRVERNSRDDRYPCARLATQVSRIPALDEHLRFILGRPNFWCYHLANALRAMGHEIARKAEEEQAAVIHWLLNAYFEHGPGWREAVEKILAAEREKELAKGGEQ